MEDALDAIVFFNGGFRPRRDAGLDVLDRGTLFADGVYEVVRYAHGVGFAMDRHLARLGRSLAGIDLEPPVPIDRLAETADELVRRRGLADAKLYLQVTRGPAARSHVMPDAPAATVLMVADPAPPLPSVDAAPEALSLRSVEDNRWGDCWIKSLMLLPNSLAKTRAVRAGDDDALFVRGLAQRGDAGEVTESTAANAMMVTGGGAAGATLRTHPADRRILPGVTRDLLLGLAAAEGVAIDETPFTLAEARAADEMLLCGTTSFVSAVTRLDGSPIGAGEPGPVTRRLRGRLVGEARRACGV